MSGQRRSERLLSRAHLGRPPLRIIPYIDEPDDDMPNNDDLNSTVMNNGDGMEYSPPGQGQNDAFQQQLLQQMARMTEQFGVLQQQVAAGQAEVQQERAARINIEQQLLRITNASSTSTQSLSCENGPLISEPSSILNTEPVVNTNAESRATSSSSTNGATSWSDPSRSSNNTHTTLTQKPFDLPVFTGRPEQWPMFISTFRQSTAAFGYSALQNLFRLQKSLRGEAEEAVQSLMMNPDNIEELINTLQFRFGRPELLVQDQIAKIRETPAINERQTEQLIPFASKVQNLVAFLNTDASRHVLSETSLLVEVVSKLPLSERKAWALHSINIRPRPTVVDFSKWLRAIAECLSTITNQPTTIVQPNHNTVTRSRMNAAPTQRTDRRVLLNVPDQRSTYACCVCDLPHRVVDYSRYRSMNVADRWTLARQHRLCFCCLRSGHSGELCRSKQTCSINGCDRQHHSSLHKDEQRRESAVAVVQTQQLAVPNSVNSSAAVSTREPNPFTRRVAASTSTAPAPTVLTCHEHPDEFPILFRIVPVVLHGPNRTCNSYALLDEGSSMTLLDADLADQLQLSGPSSNLRVNWFGSHSVSEPSREVSLGISGVGPNRVRYEMQDVRTVHKLNLPMQTVALSQVDERHRHLCGLPIAEYRNATP